MCMASFGPQVFYFILFRIFYILNNVFVFLGSIYVLKSTGRARMAAIMKTGPNDASHIVWAISFFLLFFFVFFYILTDIRFYLCSKKHGEG
jgi:hypothetical protein